MKLVQENCKNLPGSIFFMGEFLDAAVKFVHVFAAAAARALEIILPSAQKSHCDHRVTGQDDERQDEQNYQDAGCIHGCLPFKNAGNSLQSDKTASASALEADAP